MTFRLYFDEDTMRHSLVRALRARGVDVLTALDANMIERADADHLAYASGQGRVLCSSNAGDYYVHQAGFDTTLLRAGSWDHCLTRSQDEVIIRAIHCKTELRRSPAMKDQLLAKMHDHPTVVAVTSTSPSTVLRKARSTRSGLGMWAAADWAPILGRTTPPEEEPCLRR